MQHYILGISFIMSLSIYAYSKKFDIPEFTWKFPSTMTIIACVILEEFMFRYLPVRLFDYNAHSQIISSILFGLYHMATYLIHHYNNDVSREFKYLMARLHFIQTLMAVLCGYYLFQYNDLLYSTSIHLCYNIVVMKSIELIEYINSRSTDNANQKESTSDQLICPSPNKIILPRRSYDDNDKYMYNMFTKITRSKFGIPKDDMVERRNKLNKLLYTKEFKC